jgi:ppGpp synthetase/RelA/SpoT-type nucleotidyltranferase
MKPDEVVSKYLSELQPVYKLFATKVQELADSILKTQLIVPHSITSRAKSAPSLKEKIERDTTAYENPLIGITDLAGVRIITYFPKDVDRIIPLLESNFVIDRENSVDKRKAADPTVFGYASVHLVVELTESRCQLPEYAVFKGLKCEIQVRTILQHAWAEIEHDIAYKSTEEIPFELRHKFASLAGLLEVADREFELLRREQVEVRDRIAKTIKNRDLDMPLNLDSLILYLKTYHKEPIVRQRLGGQLLRVLKAAGTTTVQEFHDMLSEKALEKAEHEVKDLCPAASRCLLKYIVAVGNHYKWPKERTSELARCPALKNPEAFKKRMRGRLLPRKRKKTVARPKVSEPNRVDAGDGK